MIFFLMLKAHEGAEVDILDRLPTPFGLVRSGVAPDHPETKTVWRRTYVAQAQIWCDAEHGDMVANLPCLTYLECPCRIQHGNDMDRMPILECPCFLGQIVINQFSRVATSERCSFFGNVTLGSAVSLSELRRIYDVVVLAYGAESDRSLGIPGEDLRAIHSAREFVWWYNGHPDCYCMTPDLKSTDTAVVLGQGNVALDVARILLRPVAELATTDISAHALVSLQDSNIRKVYLVGRRGPAQAACTAKELREILGIKNLNVHIQQADLDISLADEEELKNSRIQRRVYELFSKAAATSRSPDPTGVQRELHFLFFRKPDRFLPSDSGCSVGGVRLEKTCLKENGASGKQVAVGTGEFEDLNCGLVLKSIGYKSLPVDDLPFDSRKGVVPNIKGRVLSSPLPDHGVVENGLYVAGWLKRGPTGIIATNLYCAEETVASITEDIHKGSLTVACGSPKPGRRGLLQLLEDKNVRFVPFSGWQNIDAMEKVEGQKRNRPREKIASWEELLRVANQRN
ncbi:NADPH:adrenodoxin oxidoreductase, mitochondrial isoform X1 [Iris pallida]|uniref:NADPH:adrenodoxin oxidoreductase, mitochondrial n=1 Tax=Iris pallida TaxID=29817 RepID=A0AAX6E5M6_IRIPA|nr:NADPH:adrenodoxin oxidoreductase, mitochondrial isoform X1 [Iris pallida]